MILLHNAEVNIPMELGAEVIPCRTSIAPFDPYHMVHIITRVVYLFIKYLYAVEGSTYMVF